MLRVMPFANAAAILGAVLHFGTHLWAWFAPRSYEWVMNVFVAGVRFEVKPMDSSARHLILGGILEIAVVWTVALGFAVVYNRLIASSRPPAPPAT